MSMREKLALVLKNAWLGDAAWTSPLSMAPGLVPVVIHTSDGGAFDCTVAVDAILDALMQPKGAIIAAGCNDEPPCIETYYDMIRAIKEGK